MKVRRDKAISFCADGRQGERYLGYVEKSIATIAMYILERFEDANYIDFNIVAGSWGNETNARQDKVSFFATLYLEPEPRFVFKDPTQEQAAAYGEMSEITMSREQVLSSPDLPLIKEILDAIFLNEPVCRVVAATKRPSK